MEAQNLRDQLALIDADIEHTTKTLRALDGLRSAIEGLLAILDESVDGLQLPMMPASSKDSPQFTPKGHLSFRAGLISVLQEAKGEILPDKEIWKRMQVKGVVSEAKRPEGFISLHQKKISQIEKIGTNRYKWNDPA